MKEPELRRRATCSRCAKKLGECGSPVFAVLRQQDYVIDLAAVQRQTGPGMAFGGSIAMLMGPDEDLATAAPEEVDLTLCAVCRMEFDEWLEEHPND